MLLNEILNIKYPIIQGAMANITDAKFASIVSNSGALGIIATAAMDEFEVREQIRLCKTLTDKPFGVNVMLMNPRVKEIFDVINEEHVDVVTTGAGNPGPYIEELKKNNIKIFPVVGHGGLAKRLQRYDIDGLIVEGTESGGHVGESTTLALVPQIVREARVPVIVAGGIACGKQILAAFALGGIGVQMGTIFLATNECPIHINYKNAILKAKDSDTVVTGRSRKVAVRILKNKMSRRYLEIEHDESSREELEKITLGSLKKAVFNGDLDNGSLMMGQVAGLIKEIKPVNVVLEDIWKDVQTEKMKFENFLEKDI